MGTCPGSADLPCLVVCLLVASSASHLAMRWGARCPITCRMSVKVEPDPRYWVFHSGAAAPALEHVIDPVAIELSGSAATTLRSLLPASPVDLEVCLVERARRPSSGSRPRRTPPFPLCCWDRGRFLAPQGLGLGLSAFMTTLPRRRCPLKTQRFKNSKFSM